MIRSAVLCVLLAMLLVAWCEPASSSRGEGLTLDQAVALAVQSNVNVKMPPSASGNPKTS